MLKRVDKVKTKMKHLHRIVAFGMFGLIALAHNAFSDARLEGFDQAGRVPGRYIVMFKQGAGLKEAAGHVTRRELLPETMPVDEVSTGLVAAAVATSFRGRIQHVFGSGQTGFSIEMADSDINDLAKDPRIDFIEPVMTTAITDVQTSAPGSAFAPKHLDRLDQRTLPLDGRYSYIARGDGVRIFVLDTGIDAYHGEVNGRVASGFPDCTSSGCPASGLPIDCHGHGTYAASVAGGSFFGVAKNVRFSSVKVQSNCVTGGGTSDDMARGIQWVIDHRSFSERNVILMPVQVDGTSSAVEQKVTAAINVGIVFVTGAGNNSGNACNYTPSRMYDVITVSALQPYIEAKRDTANYGTCVDLFAPGSFVWGAALPPSLADTCGGDPRVFYAPDYYCSRNGTSVAAPQVAGIAALYLQLHNSDSPAQVQAAIKTAATIGVLSDIGPGSPNRLASVLIQGNIPGGGNPPPGGGLSPAQQAALQVIFLLVAQ